MKDITNVVGKNVRELRMSKNLTQEMLAFASELDPSYLGHLERGHNNITLTTLKKVAAALHVSPARLLEESQAAKVLLEQKLLAHYASQWEAVPEEIKQLTYTILETILECYGIQISSSFLD